MKKHTIKQQLVKIMKRPASLREEVFIEVDKTLQKFYDYRYVLDDEEKELLDEHKAFSLITLNRLMRSKRELIKKLSESKKHQTIAKETKGVIIRYIDTGKIEKVEIEKDGKILKKIYRHIEMAK